MGNLDNKLLTINGRGADNCRIDNATVLCSGFKYNLVNVAVECFVGKTGQLFDIVVIVVDLV